MLTGIRFPLDFTQVGLPAAWRLGPVTVWQGVPAWEWEGRSPDLPIGTASAPAGEEAEGWGIDHVVVTTPDLDVTVAALISAGAALRRRALVRGRPAAFLLTSTLVEVVEIEGRPERLWGLALETSLPLADVVVRWRESGWDAGDPHDAVQPGREIFSVRGTTLAVMTKR
jgi:hypothetical protein